MVVLSGGGKDIQGGEDIQVVVLSEDIHVVVLAGGR